METIARYRHARESAQKVRLVADQVRGMPVLKALDVLTYSPKKAAVLIKKTLTSAISNAEHNDGIDRDELVISKIYIDESFSIKRMHARAKGRGSRIVKRSSHITIAVASIERR